MESLNRLFKPASVAVIGASEVPGKAAERRTRSLIQGGYPGKIFLINPKRDTLFGRKAYPSILDIGEEVDLVMVVVAPKLIPQAVADSVKMRAKGIVIITAGLGETGEEGKRIEAEILRTATEGGAKIIGPNCSGLFSAAGDMNLLGVPPIQKGPLAVIAQSGNIIDSITHYAEMRGVGLSHIISAGNAIGVQFHEYIDYLGQDEETKAILMYMEGIKEGGEIVRVAREVSKRKPIVILKVGRSKAGARAAASHTGSLAADDAVVDAAFRQAGIVRVANVDEMFDVAMAFANMPLPKGNRVAIVSEGGGDNSVAADNAEHFGLEVPVLPQATQERIRPFLLAGMPASNPIDYGGTAEENPDMINKVVEVLMEEQGIDSVYVTGFFGGFKEIIAPHVGELEEKTSQELVRLMRQFGKPIAVHTSFAQAPFRSMQILSENGVLLTPSSERAAQCLAYMAKFAARREKLALARPLTAIRADAAAARSLIEGVKQTGRENLLETEARELLSLYGIPLPPAKLAKTPKEAAAAASAVGFPVALKIVSPEIIHKSDAGGILLNLANEKAVREGFAKVVANAGKVSRPENVLGVLVAPMAPKGQECIIGMIRNPQFGAVLMFGLGGIFVEVLKDVSFRVAPPSDLDLEEMIHEIKGYPLLAGVRGQKPKDTAILKDLLQRVAQLTTDHPEIQEVDINPVIVHEEGASVVDARIIIT
ncbi:MAG: acetate--CoA ligase family protein [Proteobacteria bacterium]|nr:acetate--CoA ligase family protein [Pseudomonadota bacterium]MBU1744808.1 acetate--CoA ligase family protein [Pseudomonadota bacterium]MBU1965683.1 acetate--CoA ligase family protein [Pseudomonadota bacterium]